MELDPAKHGTFDLVLCFGILYHLENPVLAVRRISAVTRKVIVVDTSLMKVPIINRVLDRWPLWHMRRVSNPGTNATNITTSRWRPEDFCQFSPNAAAVTSLLEYAGFTNIVRLKPQARGLEKRYYDGRRATFIGIKTCSRSQAQPRGRQLEAGINRTSYSAVLGATFGQSLLWAASALAGNRSQSVSQKHRSDRQRP